MKTKPLFIIALLSSAISLLALVSVAQSSQYGVAMPTPAPSPTPGKPAAVLPTSVPASRQVLTPEEAWAAAQRIDASMAVRSSTDIAQLDYAEVVRNGLVTVESFKSRTAESLDAGFNESFDAAIDADAGAVWRVTIVGKAQISMIGGDPSAEYSKTVYIISSRTGELVGVVAYP